MKRFDYGTIILSMKKDVKRSAWLLGLSAALYLAVLLTGILLSTYESKTVYMVVTSISLAILSVFVVYFLFIGLLLKKREMKVIQRILNGYLSEKEGTLEKIVGPLTLNNGREVIEVVLKSGSGDVSCFFDKEFGEIPFEEGQTYAFKLSEGIIIEAEEIHE